MAISEEVGYGHRAAAALRMVHPWIASPGTREALVTRELDGA